MAGSIAYAAIVSGAFTAAASVQVSVTRVVVSKPATAAGDVMLAALAINGGSAAVVTPPSGWTPILRSDNDVNVGLATYYKVATTNEPSSYTWSVDGQTTGEGTITAYSGVRVPNPIGAATSTFGAGTTATAMPVSASAGDQIVTVFATDVGKATNAGAYFSNPSGTTEKYDLTNVPFGPSVSADESVQQSNGSTPSYTATIAGNKARNWVSQTLALKVVPPGITFLSATSTNQSSYAYSNAGNMLVACVYNLGSQPSVTYGGVPMVPVQNVPFPGSGYAGMTMFVLPNPGQGTNLVAVNGSGHYDMTLLSYDGVSSTSPETSLVDQFSDPSQGSHTVNIQTLSDRDWIVGCHVSTNSSVISGTVSPGAVRGTSASAGLIFDSNGSITPAGIYGSTISWPISGAAGQDIVAAFRPQ